MSKLILKGALADKYGEVHTVRTNNLSEAIRIVDANHPGFRTCFQKDGEYAVFKNNENIGEDRLLELGTFDTEWVIEPIPYGSKRGGVFQMVLGVVLIIAGAVAYMYGGALAMKIGMQIMVSGGISVIGGLATYLASSPTTDSDTSDLEDDKSSYLFNGPTNKTQAGHARPICYGEVYSSTINIGYSFKHVDLLLQNET